MKKELKKSCSCEDCNSKNKTGYIAYTFGVSHLWTDVWKKNEFTALWR